MDAELLAGLRALVDPNRLRIVGAARGSARRTPQRSPTSSRLPLPMVRKQLDVLVQARARGGACRTRPGTFARAAGPDRASWAAALAALEREAEADGAVLRPAARGRTTASRSRTRWRGSRPRPTRRRRSARSSSTAGWCRSRPSRSAATIVLRFLLERVFTEDREYPEKEVNQRLALFHPDVASLRRYLVDERYVEREAGHVPAAAPG